MAVDPMLLEILVCPIDKEPLYYFEGDNLLYNPRTKTSYGVNDDIPVLLPTEGTMVDAAEAKRLDKMLKTAVITGAGRQPS